jgi:predicted dehydrogenase
MEQNRREFIKKTVLTTAGLAIGMNAKSYSMILGANDRLNFAVIGLNGRAYAHIEGIRSCENVMITHICDVDKNVLNKFSEEVYKKYNHIPSGEKDFRKLLELKDIDAVTIASPDHWHAHMTIMSLETGKHVYVEKPCSHNPREGEMLVKSQKKYGKIVQMGNQQRSSEHTIKIIKKIHEGLIGKPYFGKAWYSNQRKSIGIGKVVSVPEYLDWDLWQGPAPRRPYKDNIHPYNWHWFWNWGTGETLNNGTHEVDLCRWALGVSYPDKITASGGRYHFRDDWEFYDTLVTNFEYDDKMITWEGLSCNNKKYYGKDRGVAIHGTDGTVLLDRDGYQVFSLDDKKIDEFKTQEINTSQDLLSMDKMTDNHFKNFVAAIRNGEKLRSPVAEGNISVTMLQLSNIAWKVNRELKINKENGHIMNDTNAMESWKREYEKGWELKE